MVLLKSTLLREKSIQNKEIPYILSSTLLVSDSPVTTHLLDSVGSLSHHIAPHVCKSAMQFYNRGT